MESRSEEGDLRLCFGGASFSGCRKDTCGKRHGGRTLDGVWFGVGSRATGSPRAGGPLDRQVENLSYGRPGGRVRGLTARATSEVGETNSGWRGGGPLCPLRWARICRPPIRWVAKHSGSVRKPRSPTHTKRLRPYKLYCSTFSCSPLSAYGRRTSVSAPLGARPQSPDPMGGQNDASDYLSSSDPQRSQDFADIDTRRSPAPSGLNRWGGPVPRVAAARRTLGTQRLSLPDMAGTWNRLVSRFVNMSRSNGITSCQRGGMKTSGRQVHSLQRVNWTHRPGGLWPRAVWAIEECPFRTWLGWVLSREIALGRDTRPHGPCVGGEAGLWLTRVPPFWRQDPIRRERIGE